MALHVNVWMEHRRLALHLRRVVRIRRWHLEVEDKATAAVYAAHIRRDGQLEVEQILLAHVKVEFAALLQLELAHVCESTPHRSESAAAQAETRSRQGATAWKQGWIVHQHWRAQRTLLHADQSWRDLLPPTLGVGLFRLLLLQTEQLDHRALTADLLSR